MLQGRKPTLCSFQKSRACGSVRTEMEGPRADFSVTQATHWATFPELFGCSVFRDKALLAAD